MEGPRSPVTPHLHESKVSSHRVSTRRCLLQQPALVVLTSTQQTAVILTPEGPSCGPAMHRGLCFTAAAVLNPHNRTRQ